MVCFNFAIKTIAFQNNVFSQFKQISYNKISVYFYVGYTKRGIRLKISRESVLV